MTDEFYDTYGETLAPLVKRIARGQGERFKGYGADAHDLRQECWLWAVSHRAQLDQWQEADPDNWLSRVAVSMTNACKKAGQKVKSQARGYSRNELIGDVITALRGVLPESYSAETVAELARDRAVLDADDPDPRYRSVRDPRSPVTARWAYEQLNAEDRDIIDAFHRDGCTNGEMAESRGVSPQAMSDLHHRALRRMALAIGEPADLPDPSGEFEGWEGRRSVSSAQVRAMGADVE